MVSSCTYSCHNPPLDAYERRKEYAPRLVKEAGDMRHQILCVARNEQLVAIRRILLEQQGYTVQTASAESDLFSGLVAGRFANAQLVIWQAKNFSSETITRVHTELRSASSMVVGDETASEFLENVRGLLSRHDKPR